MITYLDACQSCPPGLPDASPSIGPPEITPEGEVTAHECGTCGEAWNTLWRSGWPIDRVNAPVLEAVLKQDRSAA